ncbi:MAG: ester cyclase [Anaerolineae bacterium]|nr:ester cyclase [Chloroflexota bacterium]MBN8634267.1 ester cyclase [Anaerolineae bacterium]
MSVEHNKEVTRRFSAEVWGEGNAALADELIASDLVEHTPFPAPAPGLEGHKQVLAMFRSAFPDLKVTVDDVIGEDDWTCLMWHGDGTHTGDMMGIPATGKAVHVTGIDVLKLENGKIKERWAEIGAFSLMQQLGVIPSGQ